eukprot:6200256-Pleurochrysis_carterae.AAC.3
MICSIQCASLQQQNHMLHELRIKLRARFAPNPSGFSRQHTPAATTARPLVSTKDACQMRVYSITASAAKPASLLAADMLE